MSRRRHPRAHGLACGLMTMLSSMGHTPPYPEPDVRTATWSQRPPPKPEV